MKNSRLLRYFEEYIKKIDMNNAYAKAKYFHSLKSMDLAKTIALNFDIFNEEEIVVIELIALFHDIGNFEQSNFNVLDNQEEDNTMKSINILFDGGIMRKITKDTKYDNLIKLAIYCHNKDGLPKNINEKMVTVCNIIKDVHNIEEIRMVVNYPYIDNRINDYPSSNVYNSFKSFNKLDNKIIDNSADGILVTLSYLFALNYNYSFNIMLENEYVSKVIKSLVFEDNKIEKFFYQIELVLKNYMNKMKNVKI